MQLRCKLPSNERERGEEENEAVMKGRKRGGNMATKEGPLLLQDGDEDAAGCIDPSRRRRLDAPSATPSRNRKKGPEQQRVEQKGKQRNTPRHVAHDV